MNRSFAVSLLTLVVSWLADGVTPAYAAIITNGSFESGLTGWIIVNQAGGEGSFSIQSGTTSPVTGEIVPAPQTGLTAAMSDAGGPGSHVLYQDFVVPAFGPGESGFAFQASLFVGNRADRFALPNSLQFDVLGSGTAGFNQRARVDITLAGATSPFTLAANEVLRNVYETKVGDPLISGYTSINADLTSILAGRTGQTLRLRFAEVDNLGPFQFGVDNVDISAVPEPSSAVLMLLACLMAMGRFVRTCLGFRYALDWSLAPAI